MDRFRFIKLFSKSTHKSITKNLGITTYTILFTHLWEMLSFDFRHDVKTTGTVGRDDLQFVDMDQLKYARRYRGSPVICVKRSLERLKEIMPGIENSAFIDYGSGKGRVMFIAACAGFKNVIGVELDSTLNVLCAQNITSIQRHYPDCQFKIVEQDGGIYLPPDNVSVFFFFRPFDQFIFDKVLDKIRESLEKNPRTIFCLTLQADYDFKNLPLTKIAEETGVSIYSNLP